MPTNNAVTCKDFIRHDRHLTDFTFQPITEKDIMMMINALKYKNSCGHDGLSTILLKAIKHDICKPITLIINQYLYTDIFPSKLKLAKVILIYKKGENTKLDNYRPISILPAISKIFVRAIFDKLSVHLKSKNVLYSSQYGFRKHHSTELAVLELIYRITQ